MPVERQRGKKEKWLGRIQATIWFYAFVAAFVTSPSGRVDWRFAITISLRYS